MTAPLVPAEVNLRGLPWMRLDTTRLLDSDLFALSTGDEFKAAVALWCKSWTQTPGGSLPTDDRVLAHLSGAGGRWKRIKPMALRGWIECDDGRLYHPVVAEQAIAAWEERQEFRAEVESANERKRRERDERKAMFEALKAAGHDLAWNTPTGVLRDLFRDLSREPVTPAGVTGGVTGHSDSHGLDGTGRDGTGREELSPDTPASPDSSEGLDTHRASARALPRAPTPAGEACRAMRDAGLATTSPSHPELLALLPLATPAQFAQAAATAVSKGKGFAYALGVLKGQLADAAAPPKPGKGDPEAIHERGKAVAAEWLRDLHAGETP